MDRVFKEFQQYDLNSSELPLEEEYNYNILQGMTSEIFEEIFRLIKDDIPKEVTNLRELIPPRLLLAATIGFLLTGELYKSYGYEYYSSYSTMNTSAFTSFRPFVFSIFLVTSLIFLLSSKTSYVFA